MDKVQLIVLSLRCFVLGLLGLVPVLGAPLAVLALLTFRRVILVTAGRWNPARRYLLVGLYAGGLGLLLSLCAVVFVVCHLSQ